eukprot:519667-Amphidinium_carterae.1
MKRELNTDAWEDWRTLVAELPASRSACTWFRVPLEGCSMVIAVRQWRHAKEHLTYGTTITVP